MVDAKIVFLDEVGAGVNRTLLKTIGDAIQRLTVSAATFCMIEHDMILSAAWRPGDRCGAVLTQGTVDEVKAISVIEAYLDRLKNKRHGKRQ